MIVDEHTPARDALFRPVSDADPARCRVVQDLVGRRAAVPELASVGSNDCTTVMPEPVPLRGLLRVEVVFVVEGGSWGHPLYLVREGLPAKSWSPSIGWMYMERVLEVQW